MRDVSIEEFAEEIRDSLADQGVNISKASSLILTREFLYHLEDMILSKTEVQFSMYGRDLSHVFCTMDVKKLCNEFANGEGVSVHRLIELNKLSKNAAKFYKQRMQSTMNENALK